MLLSPAALPQTGAGANVSDIAGKLGRRVQELRAARDFTQQDLAERVGIAQATLSRIERGALGVSLDVLDKLARGLEVSVARLMDFDGELNAREDIIEATLDNLPEDPAVLRNRMRAAMRLLLAGE